MNSRLSKTLEVFNWLFILTKIFKNDAHHILLEYDVKFGMLFSLRYEYNQPAVYVKKIKSKPVIVTKDLADQTYIAMLIIIGIFLYIVFKTLYICIMIIHCRIYWVFIKPLFVLSALKFFNSDQLPVYHFF